MSSVLLVQFSLWSAQVRGANFSWDGGSNTWDNGTTLNWNGGAAWTNSVNNIGIFGGTAGTVTLADPITAGGLTINSNGYLFTGNTLTLGAPTGSNSPVLAVNGLGTRATMGSFLAGTSGFTKTGNGTLLLTSNNVGLSGDIAIKSGNVVITNQNQLGTGTTAIGITGIAGTGNPGFSGGSLVLDGSAGGVTMTREISVSGRGPGAANASGGLVSVGYNTIAGGLTLGSAASEGRAVATHGITNVTGGGLYLGTGGSNILYGNGNWIVSGQVTGSEISNDRFVKSGNVVGTTLWLKNENNSFAESLRIDSGTVRVSTNTALGRNLNIQSVDLNNGGLEVRTDTPGVGNADFSTRKIFNRDNTNTGVFVGSAVGGSAINQTVTFGETRMTGTNTNFRLTGRNGYNTTFTGLGNSALGIMGQGGANNALIENNSSGLLTLATSNLWNQTDGTSRTLTIQGNGETTLTGNIIASSGGTGHNFTKAGSGTMIFQGTASTFAGAATVSAGTLSIGTIGALNANSAGRVVFGGGTLNYTGTGETWTNKILLLNAGNNILTNNGSGALVLPRNVGNNGTGAKTLVLGGANTDVNNLTGIVNNTTVGAGLTKIGSGTWQITAPGTAAATIGTANAAFAVTLNATASQVVTTASTANLVVGQTISGGAIPVGTVITQIISPTQFAISQSTAVPASINLGTVTGSTAALAVSANTANVLTVPSTANLVPGQYISGVGMAAADGWFISAINSATTFTVANSTNTAALANSAAIGAQTPLVSPNFAGTLSIGNGTLRLNPTAAGTGSDVVNNGSGVTFGTDAITGAGSAGGVLDYRGFTGGSSETLGRLTATAGNATVRITPIGGTNTLTFGSIAAPALGSNLNFDVPASPGTNSVVITKGTTAGLLNAHAYYNGANFAFSPGGIDATLRAPVYGTDATFTAVNTLTAATNVAINTAAATGGALAVTSMKISGDSALTLAGLLTVGGATGGGILVDGATTGASITGTGVTTGSAGDLAIRVNGASDILTLSAPITSTTTGGLTKNGAGTLILNAVNALTGAFTVNEGTVRLSGAGTTIGVNTGITTPIVVLRQNTTLDLGGVAGVVSGALSGAGSVTNTGASNTWTVGNNNGSGVFSGVISNGTGVLGITKSGSGTQSLSGINTYSGVTTINAGTLAITSLANGGLPSSIGQSSSAAANLVFGGGTLLYTGSNAAIFQTTQTPSVSIDREFTLAGNATIQSSGQYGNNVLGGGAANNAALIFNSTADLSFSGAGVRTLTLGGNSTGDNKMGIRLRDNPNASEALSVTKADGGLWILGNAANSYTGTTTISGGALLAQDAGSLPTASNLFLNGGVLESTGTFNRATLGTGAGQYRFVANGNGGFSSANSKLTLDLTPLGTPTWGSTANFINAGVLLLNSATSLADVEVAGDFNLVAGSALAPTITTVNANSGITITAGGNTNNLTVGQAISGTNIPAGSYITAITGPTTFNINQNATAAGTGIAATIVAGGWREVQVNDNVSTNLDFATISGVIGGTGGLSKVGGGPLILGNANTYSGRTAIRNESVFVTSIGAAGATASSFGTNVGGGILELGNPGGANTVNLMYVGPGETTTRQINITGTTGTRRIDNSGSGALILTNLINSSAASVNTTSGARTLEIRGTNTDGNMITSVLGNDGANVLSVSKFDGGVWILNPATPNTFTGTLTAGGGTLGLTSNAIGSAASILLSNGSIMAFGGPLTTSTPITLGNNSTAVFAGTNAITINANVTKQGGANDQTFSNNLEGGALLTINGNFVNSENPAAIATRLLNVRGYGSTVWNGVIADNANVATSVGVAGSRTNLNIAIAPDASFTLTGGSANTYTGGTTLTDGILILDKVGALGTAASGGTATFAFNGGTLRVGPSIADLTGANKITNPIAINASPPKVDGAKSIEFGGVVTMGANRNLQNELTGGASLILSGTVTNTAASILSIYGAGNTSITGNVTTGTGAQGLQLAGTGTLSLTGTNLATGALTVSRSTISLSGTSGGSWNAGTAVVNPTGTLTLDNSGGNNPAGRLFDTGAFTGQGGTLNIITDGTASSETTGALTLNNVQTKITMSGAGTNTLTFASATFPNTGSSLDLSTIANLGAANKVLITAALPANALINSIMPRTFINGGADFATYSAVNGVQAFAGYVSDVNAATATQTVEFTASAATTANRTVNAIKINGSGLTISGAASNRLILGVAANVGASAILNTGGNNTLSVNEVALGANTGFIQVAPGTTLTLNSGLTGSAGLAKALSGSLTFGAGTRSFVTSTHNLLEGAVNLNGGADTLFPNFGQLTLNVGATLNLNGGGQYIGVLASPGAFPGGGGTINGGGALVTNGGGTFTGVITSATSLGRVGGGTLTLASAQTYTGTTLLMGGTTTLEYDATLLNGTTSDININNATLFLGNNNSLQYQNNDRIGDAIPLNLRGGTISVTGRLTTAASETFGVVNALQGANTITASTGGGTFTSLDLTFASLNRTAGAGVVVNFTGTNLGQAGNNARIMFTSPLSSVAGGALGGWAIANTTDFAAYNTGLGVGVVGMGGFAGYDSAFAAGNITELPGANNSTTTTLLAGGTTTTGLLKLAGNTFNNVTFTAGSDVLDIEHGGLLRSNNNFGSSIGTAAIRGILTAGGADPAARELFVFNNGSANPTFANAAMTLGSPVVTGINTVGLQPGMTVTHANFPAGTKVVAILNNGQVQLSNNATATATAQTLTTGALDTGSTNSGSAVITMASTVGVSPGMTLTGTGIPANSFVVSVDSPTQLTLSQNATATAAGTITFTAGLSNVVINSVIANNPVTSAPVTLVKSGAGILTLTAANTYTGGTIINSPLNLASPGTAGIATNVVIPSGGITINNGTVTMLTNSGQIAASNAVTLRGGSVLTLVGANTLDSLAFDNNGGTAVPTVNSLPNGLALGILTLTNATPITVTSSNPSTTATIAGNIDVGSGAKTINTPSIQVGGITVTNIVPTLAITANILSPGASINKTGNGLLQLSGQSTFTGGVNLTAGGLVIGANSTPTSGGAGITSGPLGAGTLNVTAGATLFSNSSAAVGNNIVFAGTPLFDATATTPWTLALNGTLTGAGLASPTPTINIANPGLTVALLGNIPNIGTITSFNRTGLGTLIFNTTGYTGNYDAAGLGNGLAVQLLHDGNVPNVGNGVVETIVLPGTITFDAIGTGTVTVGRAGGTLLFNQAANKIIDPGAINTVLTNGLTVANNNGYGLQVTDAGAIVGTPTYTVNTATASNVTQGLYMTGALSGTGFNKAGAGTLVLGNAGNSFTGDINIQQGVVSVATDNALGTGSNLIRLNPTAGTSTFRATGTFSTSRTIDLAVATQLRAIEVTSGNTLTLNTAFGATAPTAGLIKADLGTLELTAANPGWSGALTVTGGAVSTALATTLGTGTIIVNAPGAALQLNGGITVTNPITIDSLVDNRSVTGINTRGAIQSVTGANIISNTVTVNAAPAADNVSRNFGFGADLGATLTFNGAINFNHATGGTNRNVIIYLGGSGDLTLNGVLNNTNATPGANSFVFKNGNGTMTLTAANAIQDSEVRVYRGTTLVDGVGTFGTGATQVQVWQNGTLTLDNSTTNTASRFSNRVVQIGGGTLNFIPNAAGSSHVSTGALQISQGANTINLAAGGNQTVTFASLAQNGGATLDMIGTFGTANNKLTFTTAPANVPAGSGGLLARFTTNGGEFATYNATTGVSTFTGYSPAVNILSAGVVQTYRATSVTANSLTGNQTINAINLQSGPLVGNVPNLGGLGGLNPTTLTLTSGGILANGTGAGSNSILSVPVVALAGVEGIIHVASGQTLDVTSGFSGTAGITKSLPGTLNLNGQQFVSGNTIVNGGTLNLTSAATNTLLFNNGLGINAGATVDLKNGVQFIGSLFSANAGGNTDLGGGTLTNSGAQATLVTNSNSNFNGQITGTIFLNKTGTNPLNLQNANTYSGSTLITGGTVTLQDDGTLLSTPAIDINYGSLTLSNNTLRDMSDRVNNAAPITMKGGNLSFNGRAQTNSTETLGAVTIVEGHNTIFPGRADPGINSADLTLASLARSIGSTATLRFNNLGSVGLIGNQSRVLVTANPTLTNNILGPWAIVDREYATYDATYGISALGQAGMAGYAGSGLNTNPLATDNVRFATAGGTTILAGNTVVNTLNISQGTASAILDLGGNTLRVQGGGLLIGQSTDNTTVTISNGTITSGTVGSASDFYLIHAPFSNNGRATTISAAITDNAPITGPVRLILAGGDGSTSQLILTGTNTYTGGTVINQGTRVLGATGTLGSGGITVNGGTFIQTAGGVIPSQNLTLGGSSVVTLAGANSLSGITFNNMGGGAPTLNPTGTLTLTGGIAVTTMNAGAISAISNGTLDLNAAPAYSVNVGATLVNGKDVAPWQSGLTINSIIQNGGIAKSGNGMLQLGGQSTFTGGINASAGGLIIAANSSPNGLLDPVISGPLGTGAVTMAGGTSLVAGVANAQVSNDFTFLGNTVFNGVNNLTLNGVTTLPAIWNATVTAPQMTVTIGDINAGAGTINKDGLGILVVGNFAGAINAAGGLLFSDDGNTLGTLENISIGAGLLTITGDTAITVNRSGGAPNARNKTLQKGTLSVPGNIMSVSNLNGYGLEFTGTTTMTGPSHFAVGTATASNVVQGLILSGQVTDGASDFGIIKSGPGTLVLSDASNSFGGAGSTIDILNGILSVSNDGALGNALNTVTLNVDATTGVGFRSTGTFSTARTFNLNQANNAFEVTAGNVLTLTSPFVLSAATNTLTKNDNGVFAINADNSTWTGPITINAGAIRMMNNNAIGSGVLTINNAFGSALQLDGGVTYSRPIILALTGQSGINSGGVIQAVSGTNIVSGLITQNNGVGTTIGADAGATLNITAGIDTINSTTFNVGAGGNINLSGVSYGNGKVGGPGLNKIGNGTLTLSVNSATATAPALNVSQGTMILNSAGVLGGAATTAGVLIDVGGTLTLNNTTAAGGSVDNRLGGSTRPITFRGGNFNLIGTDAGGTTAETLDAPTFAVGFSTITVTTSVGNQAALLFDTTSNIAANPQNAVATAGGGPTGASILFRGTNLGTAAAAGVATIQNTGTGTSPTRAGFNFNGATGVTGSTTKGIMPWAILETTDSGTGATARFATGDAAAGAVGTTAILRQLSNSEMSAANAVFAANVNQLVTASRTVTGSITPNSATIESSGGLVISPFVTLSMASGGYLLKSGNNGITGGILSQFNTSSPFNIWAVGDTTITSLLNGGNGTTNGAVGFVKAGAGILTLSTPQFGGVSLNSMSGQTVINQGTLKLNGGTNTIQANNYMQINQGGTLDLNGNSQQVFGLFTTGAVSGSGGIITSTAGTGNLVVNQDANNRNWAGSIQGSVNFTRSGQNTLTLYSPQTYTGTTLINGGTTTLRDDATLSGTGTLDINYATLLAENGGTIDLTDRINDSKAITLRGGTLTVQGRVQTASSETLGAVTIHEGFNVINPLVGGTGINSVDVSLASLSRPAGSSATLIVQGTNLGTIGSNSRVTVGTLNGVATTNPVYSPNGSGLTNNLVGGWAENGNDFLTYIPGLGFAALNQVGAPQYDLNNTFIGGASTDNVRLTASTAVPLGGKTINAVSMSGSAINLTFLGAADILNITSGGLIGPNNNQVIGTTALPGVLTAGGSAPAANSDLYVFNRGNTLTINSKISNNTSGGGSIVRAVFTASGGAITLVNPANDYTGGTVLNGGTLNLTNTAATAVIPAGGLQINGGTVTMNNFAGQIAAANIVTLNNGVLNYFGNNTQTGFVMNNIGGTGNPTVQSFTTGTAFGAGSNGVLTIGASGIVANSSNVGTTNIFVGRVDFGAAVNTIDVAPIRTNGIDIAPFQAALAIQGIVGTTGGIDKVGNGVLQFNAQAHYTGPTHVLFGSIRTGVQNGGSRLSALTLDSGTFFNINGTSTTWGSLAGSGTVFNTGGANTLTVGFDNAPTTTFSGQLARFNDAVVNAVGLQKVGTGEMVMTSAQAFATGTTGTITVNGGTLKYRDSGEAFNGTAATGGGTFSVNNGALLALDNSGSANVNSRLGLDVIGTLNMQGGRLTLNGNSGIGTTETITSFNVVNGGGRVELTPDAANTLQLAIATLNTANGSGTLVVGGINGSSVGTIGQGVLTITTPNLLGGQGTGANGTVTMGVRHDILGDATIGGLGTGFLVRDTVATGNSYRALAASELAAAIALPLATDVDPITAGNQGAGVLNVGLVGATQALNVNSIANTLTISGTSTVNSGLGAAFGSYGPGGNLLTLSLSNAAASLTLAGATGTINTAFGSTTVGTTPFVHVIAGGTLNVNGAFAVGGTAGMAKADGGAMNLNNRAYYTGTTSINNGILRLNSGTNDTLAVVPTTGAATLSQVNLNGTGSVLDLMGRNQAIGALTSINPLPGNGGTVQNTGVAATLTTVGAGTFSGAITGNLALTRAGNTTTTLTNANTYTGATIVRGGTLELRDSGTLASTAGLTLNYGQLNWNNFGLNAAGTPNPTRIAAANAVTLQGGTFTINGAGSTDTNATLNTVNVTGGNNVINTLPFINEGSTVKLTIGNLVRNVNNHSGVVFNGFTTNNSSGSGTLGGQGLTTNSNIIVTQVNGATGPLNQVVAGAVTTAGSATVTVPSTLGLVVGQPITGTGLPAGKTILSIDSPTQFTLNNGTGVTAQAATTLTSTNLTDGLIGGWAVADGNTFATYSNIYGVVAMGSTYGGFLSTGFTGTDVSAALVATGNYSDAGTTRSFAAGAVVANSLRFVPTAAQTITLPTTTTLALDVGIITNAAFSTTLAATDATNTISGTGTDLYFYVNQNTVAVQPAIIGTAALVSNGPSTLSLRPTFASNTYSGGTFANAGTLNLQAASPFIAIPGDLTVNNATVNMSTVSGQIAPTSNVFINGGGSVTLGAYTTGPTQTLASVTFTNDGGNANPTLSLGTPTTLTSTLILSSATPITSTNNSLATTPTISTGAAALTALQFSDANPALTVTDGLAETELTISAPITQHVNMLTLSKTGTGVLALSGQSTFTTGFNLNQGSLLFGANSTPTSGVVTSGPVGTGTLTIAGGTSLLSDAVARIIANAITVNGDFTFGGRVSTNNLTLAGAMNLGATGRTITVDSPAVTSTISGAITSAATGTVLTKAGAGTLILSNSSSNLNGGTVAVTGGILKNGVNNAIPVASAVAVSVGAGYDLNGFAQTVDGITGAGFITNSANSSQTLTVSSTVTNSAFAGILTDNILAQATSRLNLTKAGAGTTLTLANAANDYSGVTTVTGGVLAAAKLANGASTSSIGDSSNAATNLVLDGGSLSYVGTGVGNGTTDRNFTLGTAGGGLDASGASGSAMVLTSTSAVTLITGGARALTLSGSNTDSNTLAASIGNSTGATSLIKSGAGNWVVTANNGYTGTTIVNGGVLQVGTTAITSATLGGTGAAQVTVNAGGTLTGTGTVTGNVVIGGTGTTLGVLTAGDSFGATNASLNVGGNLSIDASGQLQFGITTRTYNDSVYLGGSADALAYLLANPGQVALWNAVPTLGNSDFINVAGSLTIAANANSGTIGTVKITNNGYAPQMGDVFNLIDWAGAMSGGFNAGTGFTSGGLFGDFDLPVLSGGLGWDTSAFQTYGVVAVVPEPSRALLMLFGLLALFFRRRRE